VETEAKVGDTYRSGTHPEVRPDASLTNTPAEEVSDGMAETDPITGRSPAFQFYPKDFLHDSNVVLMNLSERGAYITLLCYCWSEGSIYDDPAKLAKFCHVTPSVMRRLWPALAPCFRPSDEPGRLIHPRLERERQKQAEFKQRQSDNGKKGGRPPKPPESQNNPSLSSGLSQTEPKKSSASSSAISSLQSSSADSRQQSAGATLTERAGLFCDWYQQAHSEVFNLGYIGNPNKDYMVAQDLCRVFTDQELQDATYVWFGMDDKWATESTRTIPRFASRATKCVEKARKVTA
jgi:uncharacterized protein YdaU (DUF1376 family)